MSAALRHRLLITALVFFAALAPRLFSPSPFLTWDEPTWTYRSLRFTRAIERGDFAAAWQSPHPGVVTLWAGSAGIAVRRIGVSESDLAWVDDLPEFDEDNVELLRQVLPWHPAARAAIGWLSAGLIALAAWILVPMIGVGAALIAGLLMALDPYVLAHSRVIHLDAVLALLITCSALAAISAFNQSASSSSASGRRFALIAFSGVLGGLAVLEKSPGVFAAGFAGLCIVICSIRVTTSLVSAFRDATKSLVIWGGSAAATYLAVWPALWGDTFGTFSRMAEYAAQAAGRSREAVFFMSQVRPDPGALFYFVAIPHRLSPLALGGLVVGVVAVAAMIAGSRQGHRSASGSGALIGAWMLTLAVLFTVLMGQSAKKFERYDLPAFPALQIVAAIGLVGAAGWAESALRRRSAGRAESVGPVAGVSPAAIGALALLVLIQAAFTLRHQPYGLSYYNPLLGGGPSAAGRLPVGWGEGSDLVVEWLNEQPGAAESSVATPSMTLVGPRYVGQTLRAKEWPAADWVVLYVDDVQIGEPRDIVEAFHGVRTPIHVVRLNGIDYGWVYAVQEGGEPRETDGEG